MPPPPLHMPPPPLPMRPPPDWPLNCPKGAVTGEMIREAKKLREKDASNSSTAHYSRECTICGTKNPHQRAVFSNCGHIVCYSCAVDNARSNATGKRCVFCRTTSGFIKLFEEEFGNEK
ncbi:hypothetical protein PENTCL1PPCAC_11091, partial [Pristionchus entomophagus]